MILHLRQITVDQPIAALSVSRDGSLIAVGIEASVELIDCDSGSRTGRVVADAEVSGLALSTDKQLLAVATGAPTVRVYDRESGRLVLKLLRTSAPDFLRKQRQIQVEFLGTGRTLITRADNSDVTIWNCETGAWEHLFRMPHRNAVCAVSPGGGHFAMFGEPNPNQYTGQVTVYRMNQGPEHRWHAHHANDRRVTSASFSPDASRLAACGAGDGIRVWNVDTGEPMFQIPERDGGPFLGAMFVADEHHLLTIQDQILATFKLGNAEPLSTTNIDRPRRIAGFCGSADGTTVATYNHETGMALWKISKAP